MTRSGAALLLLATGCVACASSRRPESPLKKLAVLPFDPIGVSTDRAARVRSAVIDQADKATAELLARSEVDRVTAELCGSGKPDEECALGVGRHLGASHVLIGALAGLGQTHLLQLQLLATRTATVARSLEETLVGPVVEGHPAVVDAARRVLDLRPQPWYRRWWVWTLAATTVAAAVTAVVLPFALAEEDPYRDIALPPARRP